MSIISIRMDILNENAPELLELKTAPKVVGMKQLRRALKEGRVSRVFLASDADPGLIESIAGSCQSVPCFWVVSMKALGRACGIDVGAAAAAVLQS